MEARSSAFSFVCITAVLVSGSPASDGQISGQPDDQFYLYEGPSNHWESVGHFEQDTPAVITDAPYSGIGTTNSVTTLGDWGTMTNRVQSRHLRDGQGRTRTDNVKRVPDLEVVRIDDPVAGQRYMLFPDKKRMLVRPFLNATGAVVQRPMAPPPPTAASLQVLLREFGGDAARAPGRPVARTVPLGNRSFDGIRAVGERREYTLPGKTAPIRIVSEQWFSPELGVVMMNSIAVWVTPRATLKSTYRLSVTPGEPDPALFRIPEDYAAAKPNSRN